MNGAGATADGLERVLAPVHGPKTGLPLVIALVLHAGLVLAMPRRLPHASAPLVTPATELFELAPPPPPPEAPPPDPPAAPKAVEPPAAKAPAQAPVPAAAPPAVARAAQAVTQKEDAPAPLTFDTMVTGDAATFAGGTSAREGTGRGPGGTAAFGSGSGSGSAPAGSPPPAPAPAVDRSQRARLAGGGAWSCPFPAAADEADVDHAVVGLRIEVDASGRATAVSVTRDPGHGFGSAARSCALAKRYDAALDPSGAPLAGSLALNVRFDR